VKFFVKKSSHPILLYLSIPNTRPLGNQFKSISDHIMKGNQDYENKLPVSKELVLSRKKGHPKFYPYGIGQKVLEKIQRIGNRLKYKLHPRYDGSYEIVKSRQNCVTFEIKCIGYQEKKSCYCSL